MVTAKASLPNDGPFQFTVNGQANRTTIVETTTNLGDLSSWTPLTSFMPVNGTFVVVDTQQGSRSHALQPGHSALTAAGRIRRQPEAINPTAMGPPSAQADGSGTATTLNEKVSPPLENSSAGYATVVVIGLWSE